AILLGYCTSASAQAKPSDVASVLFKNVKTKLTIAEQNEIAKKLFILSSDKDHPFATDKDSKDYPFAALVMPTDMNKDGKEEIFISFGNSYTSGNAESSVSLFIKNATGIYTLNLGFPGTTPDALATSNQGYLDLLVGGPGMEYPVYRWNGKEYAYLRDVKDADYGKLKSTNVAELSKAYQATVQ
ncbi:MAG TPA: hypothetical protein VEV83_20940, partial [Parafilimonas sp.]|nr:hypothetical protein [Parafilimonas sp.]